MNVLLKHTLINSFFPKNMYIIDFYISEYMYREREREKEERRRERKGEEKAIFYNDPSISLLLPMI